MVKSASGLWSPLRRIAQDGSFFLLRTVSALFTLIRRLLLYHLSHIICFSFPPRCRWRHTPCLPTTRLRLEMRPLSCFASRYRPLLLPFSSSSRVLKPLPSSTLSRARTTTRIAFAVARLPDLVDIPLPFRTRYLRTSRRDLPCSKALVDTAQSPPSYDGLTGEGLSTFHSEARFQPRGKFKNATM